MEKTLEIRHGADAGDLKLRFKSLTMAAPDQTVPAVSFSD